MSTIYSYIKDNLLSICQTLAIILLFISTCYSVKCCIDYKQQGDHNIKALTDSISYYKTKHGDLVAKKTILEGNISTLKLVNDSLYKVVKDMGVKSPADVIYIKSTIDNGTHDTAWIVLKDTITNNIRKDFAFNDDYRALEGEINYNDTTLSLNISKDEVYFDYTIAVENGIAYIKSNNPYIKYNEITGITIPKHKPKWTLGIGPSVGYGYDFVAKKPMPYVGIGINLNYNLFQFGNK